MDKSLYVVYNGTPCCIPTDRIEKDDAFVISHYDNQVNGIFSLMTIDVLYVSEKKKENSKT